MTLTGQVRMTYPLLRRLNYGTFTPLRVAKVVVALALLVGTAVTITRATPLIACAAVCFVPAYEWALRRSWLRLRHLTDDPWRYEVGPAQVSVTTPATHLVVAWAEISRARTARHAWYLTTASSRRNVVVPRSAFSPDAQSEIDALVAAHAAPSRAR